MSQYISKKALNNIPLNSKVLKNEGKTLQSFLLRKSNYLIQLAQNNPSYPELQKNKSSNEAVKLIKLALNTIDELNIAYPSFNIVHKLDTRSFEFNQELEDAVKNFQGFASLTINGKIDTQTVLAIDKALTGDSEMLFDNEYTKYIGKANKKTFVFNQAIINNKYVYSVFITESGSEIKVNLENPLKATVIRKSNNKVYLKPNHTSKQELLQDKNIKAELSKNRLLKVLDGNNFNVLIDLPAQIKIDASYASIIDIDAEIENTPPEAFNDVNEKLYKIKQNDKLSNIIEENYYGEDDYVIKNPYNNSNLFIFPKRTPFDKTIRHEDARYQFYINLLYYYNSQEINGDLKEWGIAKNSNYTRYSINHLEALNIFDNKFDNTQNQTALPNYYRFLKKMEGLNPNSKLNFDSEGECTSFGVQVGKNIRIPSRKFADSLYNFLNFRHNEMLREVPSPDSPGESVLDWVADNVIGGVINAMESAMESISNLSQEVKIDAIALYNETISFFKAAYDFAIKSLIQYWPRGAGGFIKAGIEITWGYPIKTSLEYSKSLKRKMTKDSELTIVYTKESALGLGLDIMAEGAQIGFYSGHGNQKKGFGIDYGTGADVGGQYILGNEYEFPIRIGETALLTMIINVFAGEVVKSTADILTYLKIINLDPRQYITKFEIKHETTAKVWGAAQLGLKVSQNTEETEQQQDNNRSFAGIDNIFSKIIDVGYSAELSMNLGVSFSYTVDYGENPLIFEGNGGRMFDKVELDLQHHIHGQLSTGKLGSFLGKIFGSIALPGLDIVLGLINFDRGIMLGINYQLERKSDKLSISANDLKFVPLTSHISFLPQGGIAYYNSSSKVKKSLSLYFGTYSGDVDSICQSGSEVKLSIDALKLYNMCIDSNYDFTFSNILGLFKEFSYKKKVGLLYEGQNKKKLIVKEKHADNDVPSAIHDRFRLHAGNPDNYEVELTTQMLSACLKNRIKDNEFFLSSGIALSLQMTIEFEKLLNLFKFYLKKLYWAYLDPNMNSKIVNDIFRDRKKKIDDFLKTQPHITGATYYETLYSEGIIAGSTNIKGLLGWINEEVPNFDGIDNKIRRKLIPLFVKGIMPFNHYLNHKKSLLKSEDYLDFGLHDVFNWFAYIAELGKLELALEAKLGVAFGGQLKGGLFGITAGVSLNALAELNYQAEFYKEGKLVGFAETDAFKAVFDEIDQMLGELHNNKRIRAKKLFSLIS